MEIKLVLTRDVLKTECSWLKEDLKKGDIIFKYNKCTYGAITPNGIACSKGYNVDPFFEVPINSVVHVEKEDKSMKSYKLVNSEEVIEKAERLGYSLDGATWLGNRDIIILGKQSKNYFFREISSYKKCHSDYQEITQAAFLALPEPLKVGDYIFTHKTEEEINVRKVHHVGNEVYISKNTFVSGGIDFYSKRKLTQEQIDILGLEE
jgi:hypothetical protein